MILSIIFYTIEYILLGDNMNDLKKLGYSLAYVFIILCSSIFLLTILHYFGIMNGKIFSFFKIICLLSSLFIGGFINGKRSLENGWLEGLKLSLILLILWILIGLCFQIATFSWKHILFYIIIVAITTFGSMIGINKKKSNTN